MDPLINLGTIKHLFAGLLISKTLLEIFKVTPGRVILAVFAIAISWEILDGYLNSYNSLQDSIVDVLFTVLTAIIVVV